VRIAELRTPAVLIDVNRAKANIDRMQARVRANNIRLRPHAKTHKSPIVAQWQIDAGAVGVCCAKVGEAEVFADAGIRNIRLPYPVHPSNADRIVALLDRVELSIITDLSETARAWSEAMTRAGRTLNVLVKVDVGFHRCGIDPYRPDAADFIAEVGRLPGLRLQGLLSHAGHAYHASSEDEVRAIAVAEAGLLNEVAAAARAKGATIDEISVGATPTARFSAELKGISEMRPGNYVYLDRAQVSLGAGALTDCALTVLARVVTKHKDRVIFDSGSKTLTSDGPRGGAAGYGAVFTSVEEAAAIDDGLLIERLSEEHATVRAVNGTTTLEPGDHVRILPNHSCVVSNLVDEVFLVDGMNVVDRLPVAARGRIT
jgi:D-serine deaminase-like pyridoxal phosphate-dependent protein